MHSDIHLLLYVVNEPCVGEIAIGALLTFKDSHTSFQLSPKLDSICITAKCTIAHGHSINTYTNMTVYKQIDFF